MKTILCVEDDEKVLRNNKIKFTDDGYTVLTAETLAEAREHLKQKQPDAIVLDIMLPDGLGLDLLKEIRERGSNIPVLLLTAWGKPSDIARGLRAGANDYLSKPFDYEVLLARVEAMFRNVEQMPETIIKGALRINIPSMAAFVKSADMLLSQKEFALILLFVQHENRFMSAEYLYEKVWGRGMMGDDNAVRVAVSRLRKKLKNSEYTITAERGEGYCFERQI
jgi:DNA-binding response OmpR family regulator